jgi:ketosteroid isomerase-like protein
MSVAIEETNAATARTFLETLSTGDLERVAPLFEADATWTVCASGIPGAGSHRGRAIFEEFLGPVRGLFEPGQPRVEVTNLVAQGSWVAIEATGRGRFRTGTPYENHYSFWIEVSGGLIRTVREYMDSQYVASLVP